MNNEIQKEVEEFFKLPEQKLKAIQKRVNQEKEHWYNKLNIFGKSKTNEEDTDEVPAQHEVPFAMHGESDTQLRRLQEPLFPNKAVKILYRFIRNIPLWTKTAYYYMKQLRSVGLNPRIIIFMLLLFLFGFYVGGSICTPPTPPLIEE